MQIEKNVLVSAFSCAPDEGSEEDVAWNWIKQISRFNNVYVLTRPKYKKRITEYVKCSELKNVKFIFIKDPLKLNAIENSEIGIRIYYYYWQLLAFLFSRKIVQSNKIDLIHHVTLVMLALPSFLPLLPFPFIWNVAGGQFIPKKYFYLLGVRGAWFELIRIIGQYLSKLDPFTILAKRKSKIIICSNQETYKFLPNKYRSKAIIRTQVGMENAKDSNHINKQTFEFIIVGRLIPLKAVSLGIRAFNVALRHNKNIRLKIIGDGKDKNRLENIVKDLNIKESVLFLGALPRVQTLEEIKLSDVLVFPSLRDSAGMVILEAMSFGKPVICLNHGGGKQLVNDNCGIKIKITTIKDTIAQIAEAMIQLSANKDLYNSLSLNANLNVKDNYTWNSLGLELNQLYCNILTNKAPI